jgi:hypothetical protein
MTEQDAGRYLCYYVSRAGSSKFSEPLNLMVTGDGTLRGPSPSICLQERVLDLGVSPSHSPALSTVCEL